MKKRFQMISRVLLLFIIGAIVFSACKPKEPGDSDDYTLVTVPDVAIASPVASHIATWYLNPDLLRFRFRLVDAGRYPLGSDPDEDSRSKGDETPQVDVHLPGFWMSEGEVTNKEYSLCVEAGICSVPTMRETGPTTHYGDPAYDEHPVVGVDWFQADGYCKWILARLPTEAEWEKAAGGSHGYIYPWGNDAPTCDKANGQLPGCEGEGDTKPTGSYPLGASPYGFLDMAGNVREWMQDWYKEDAYLTAASYNPTGPTEGEKKVVRGGGFNDFEENLRTTTRWGYEPELDFDDVGFRCIPVTPKYAPFCEPSYPPLCYDPRIPKDDEPCEPGPTTPGEEGVTLLGFGCPMNKIVCFEASTHGGGTAGYTAMVDADGFDCKALDDRPDIIQCCGPEQPMGRNVSITICAPGGSPEGEAVQTTAQSQSPGIKLASFSASGAISLMRVTTPSCPDGFTYDSETEQCVLDPTRLPCPENWGYDPKSGECVQNNQGEDCPPTTTYSPDLEGCTPDEGECPEGYFLTNRRTCEPEQNRGDQCPPGYYLNTMTNCCEPIKPDNFGCPEGTFWHEKYKKCVPMDDNNCAFGMTYDGYGMCNQNPLTPGPDDPPDGDCPPGLLVTNANNCGQEDPIGTPANPAPGTGLRIGDQVTPDGLVTPELAPGTPPCEKGFYYDPKYETCVERDPDGCMRGYYFDTMLEKCVPTNGPNSPCPVGYVYDPETDCCVPQPGFDGTRCPEDEETPIGTPDLTQAFQPFKTSSFDMESGECEDDGRHGDGMPCPPTTFAMNNGNCGQYPDSQMGELPGEPDETAGAQTALAQCPEEYWNAETQTCDVPLPECGENEYFDTRKGFCVPLQDDCCELGQDYSAYYKECVDIVTKPRDGECPNGFELIGDLCWLIDRTEGKGGMCWTITRNTPRCVGPCEVGLIYNELTGRCDEPYVPEEPKEPSDPCAGVKCSSYSYKNCPSNCCKLVEVSSGNPVCKKK